MRIRTLFDWILPTAESLSEFERNQTDTRKADIIAFAEAHVDPNAIAVAYEALTNLENERRSSVESRLGEILRLVPITASLLVGGMLVLLNGGLKDSPSWVRIVIVAALFYLNLQLVCSTIAAIRGLRRSTWRSISIEDLVCQSGIGPNEWSKQRAMNNCERFLQAEQNTNLKVTQMAVAQIAIRNFAAFSALMGILGLSAVVLQRRAELPKQQPRSTSVIPHYQQIGIRIPRPSSNGKGEAQ